MYQLGKIDGFNVFCPHPDIVEESRGIVEEQYRINREVLAEPLLLEGLAMPVSGSFIYAHPPDYRGVPTLEWGEKEWLELFGEMLLGGIDTVIFQASLWHELKECYYRSRTFQAEYRIWQVLENMLPAVKKSGIKLFLGGYGSVVGWSLAADHGRLEEELTRQFRCLEELAMFQEFFAGIYFTPETAVTEVRDLRREKFMNQLYCRYFSQVKELLPQKLCVISPATKYAGGVARENIVDGWLATLDRVPCDILAPQDSIGCCGCNLREQPDAWQAWYDIARHANLRLWANVEVFERRSFSGSIPFISASPDRVARQIANVAPYVEKIVIWEYPYFIGKEQEGKLRRLLFR